jgi:hypothetical protein
VRADTNKALLEDYHAMTRRRLWQEVTGLVLAAEAAMTGRMGLAGEARLMSVADHTPRITRT